MTTHTTVMRKPPPDIIFVNDWRGRLWTLPQSAGMRAAGRRLARRSRRLEDPIHRKVRQIIAGIRAWEL
jgi:hypothetical protein